MYSLSPLYPYDNARNKKKPRPLSFVTHVNVVGVDVVGTVDLFNGR